MSHPIEPGYSSESYIIIKQTSQQWVMRLGIIILSVRLDNNNVSTTNSLSLQHRVWILLKMSNFLSTQIVNLAHFARYFEWDFFFDFCTPCSYVGVSLRPATSNFYATLQSWVEVSVFPFFFFFVDCEGWEKKENKRKSLLHLHKTPFQLPTTQWLVSQAPFLPCRTLKR